MRISDWSSDVCSSDLGKDHKKRPRQKPGHLPTEQEQTAISASCQHLVQHSPEIPRILEADHTGIRSEERRVGKECVSTWRSRWSQNNIKKTRGEDKVSDKRDRHNKTK